MNTPMYSENQFPCRQVDQASGKGPVALLSKAFEWRPLLILPAICLMLIWHCSRPARDGGYLLRVGKSVVTVSEFNRAVEAAAEEAYPGEQEISSASQNDLRMRVLNQLAEELIISERAKALGISLSDEELERAVADIKSDYPDNTFEKTLLENAVSFQAWEKKLATRLLINKVIKSELVDKVEITSQDVAAYFQTHYPEGVPEGENADEIDQRIVQHLRQQKAEKMYQAWIKDLRKVYPVDVDQDRWNRLVGSKTR
jgi:SurA-like N-terminal domain